MSGDRPRKSSKSKIRGTEPTLVATSSGEAKPRPRRMRGDEPTLIAPSSTVLYRPVDEAELARMERSGYAHLAPIEGAETIQLLCDEANARALAGPGWVTRFALRNDFIDRHPRTGSAPRQEIRVPASELRALNDAILGVIVVLR